MGGLNPELLARIYPICIGVGVSLALLYAGCILQLARRLNQFDQTRGRAPTLTAPYGWSQSTSLLFGATGRRVAAEAPENLLLLNLARVCLVGYVLAFLTGLAILFPVLLRAFG